MVDTDDVVAELGLDRPESVTGVRVQYGVFELGNERTLQVAAEVAALLGAGSVARAILGQLREIATVLQQVMISLAAASSATRM